MTDTQASTPAPLTNEELLLAFEGPLSDLEGDIAKYRELIPDEMRSDFDNLESAVGDVLAAILYAEESE